MYPRLTVLSSSTEFHTPVFVQEYRVKTGQLGREDVVGRHVTSETAKMIPLLEAHIADGTITPVECEMYKGVGWETLAKAIGYFEAGRASKKPIVRVQEG